MWKKRVNMLMRADMQVPENLLSRLRGVLCGNISVLRIHHGWDRICRSQCDFQQHFRTHVQVALCMCVSTHFIPDYQQIVRNTGCSFLDDRFHNNTVTEGYVDGHGRGHCVSPLLYRTGLVSLEISYNGSAFNRAGTWLSGRSSTNAHLVQRRRLKCGRRLLHVRSTVLLQCTPASWILNSRRRWWTPHSGSTMGRPMFQALWRWPGTPLWSEGTKLI